MKKLILGLGSAAAAVAPVAAVVSCSFGSDSTTENIVLNQAQKDRAESLFGKVQDRGGKTPPDLTSDKFVVQDAYKIAGSDYTSGFQVNIHVSQAVHESNGFLNVAKTGTVMFQANRTYYLAVTKSHNTYTLAVYKIPLTGQHSLPTEKFNIDADATQVRDFYNLLDK